MAYPQGYDALKTQLQFENYYGAKLRASKYTSEISGSETLVDEWHPLEVTFADGSAYFDQGKINLLNTTAEVIYKDKEMFIAAQNIKLITLPHLVTKRWFLPASDYQHNGVSLEGFLEVFNPLVEFPCIMTQHYIYIKKPSSNGYVNAGTLEEKLVKSSKNFYYDGKQLILIKNKKSLEKFYQNEKANFIKYAKELRTDFKNPKSLHELITAMKK